MDKEVRYDIWGGVLVVTGLFILLTIMYPQTTGIVGSVLVNMVLINFLGKVYLAAPILLGLSGLFLLFPERFPKAITRIIGLSILTANLAAVTAMLTAEGPIMLSWPIINLDGGYLGVVLGFGLEKVFGLVGAFFMLLVSTGFSVMLITNKGLGDIYKLLTQEMTRPTRKPEMQAPNKTMQVNKRKAIFAVQQGNDDDDAVPIQPAARPIRRMMADVQARPVRATSPVKPRMFQTTSGYKLPPLSLLHPPIARKESQQQLELQFQHDKEVLERTLASFNVAAKVCNISHGPAVTRYELMPSPGVRVNKIANLSDDISLTMAATVRIEAPVPGKSVVGIEVPNPKTRPVYLSELSQSEEFHRHPLRVALGLDIAGKTMYCDLHEMPHLLIAGATGSGKSVCINTLIMSILLKASPDQVKLLMIDPKRVELLNYDGLPHLVAPVVHEPHLAPVVLKLWAIKEMERRYEIFSKVGVRNIQAFNTYAERNKNRTIMINAEVEGETKQVPYQVDHMPYVVIIIDELADLMMVGAREVESSICRIAQMARATGMHLVIATQRPSVDVITGLIKANVPSRIAFAVGSHIDSRTIIDGMGAEKLLGKGDMLYSPVGARHLTRIQGVYVSDNEIQEVTQFIRRQSPPNYELDLNKLRTQAAALDQKNNNGNNSNGGTNSNQRDDGRDVLFDEAAQLIASTGKQSISYIQRKFRIGYNRAARIMEELVEAGLVIQQ